MDPHKAPHSGEHSTDSVGHEERDISFRPIVWGGIGMLIVTVLIFVLVRWVYVDYVAREAAQSPAANPLANSYGRQVPPEPRLQTKPVQDLAALHASEDAVLSSYGWVDRKAGIVRMPITQAMQLLVQRGLPAEPETGGHP